MAPALSKDTLLILGLSGRGDKDIDTVMAALGQHR
jgi:tryptophan synthase beta subunit